MVVDAAKRLLLAQLAKVESVTRISLRTLSVPVASARKKTAKVTSALRDVTRAVLRMLSATVASVIKYEHQKQHFDQRSCHCNFVDQNVVNLFLF